MNLTQRRDDKKLSKEKRNQRREDKKLNKEKIRHYSMNNKKSYFNKSKKRTGKLFYLFEEKKSLIKKKNSVYLEKKENVV